MTKKQIEQEKIARAEAAMQRAPVDVEAAIADAVRRMKSMKAFT